MTWENLMGAPTCTKPERTALSQPPRFVRSHPPSPHGYLKRDVGPNLARVGVSGRQKLYWKSNPPPLARRFLPHECFAGLFDFSSIGEDANERRRYPNDNSNGQAETLTATDAAVKVVFLVTLLFCIFLRWVEIRRPQKS